MGFQGNSTIAAQLQYKPRKTPIATPLRTLSLNCTLPLSPTAQRIRKLSTYDAIGKQTENYEHAPPAQH